MSPGECELRGGCAREGEPDRPGRRGPAAHGWCAGGGRRVLIRGPGEFLGARQSGVPLLRFADLERDVKLIEQARNAADELLRREPGAAQAHLERWLGGKQEFIRV